MFVQAAFNESLTEATNRRLVGHGLVCIQLEKLLKAQAVVDLDFGLRVAQAVEMLQDHYAAQHADADGRASAVAVSGRHACLRLAEIHFAGNGFQHTVGSAALPHGEAQKGGWLSREVCRVFRAFYGSPCSKDFRRDFLSKESNAGSFGMARVCRKPTCATSAGRSSAGELRMARFTVSPVGARQFRLT